MGIKNAQEWRASDDVIFVLTSYAHFHALTPWACLIVQLFWIVRCLLQSTLSSVQCESPHVVMVVASCVRTRLQTYHTTTDTWNIFLPKMCSRIWQAGLICLSQHLSSFSSPPSLLELVPVVKSASVKIQLYLNINKHYDYIT